VILLQSWGLTRWPLQIPYIPSFLWFASFTNWKKEWKLCCVTTRQTSSSQTRLQHASDFFPQNTLYWPGLQIGPIDYPRVVAARCFYRVHHREELHFMFFLAINFATFLPICWLAPEPDSSSSNEILKLENLNSVFFLEAKISREKSLERWSSTQTQSKYIMSWILIEINHAPLKRCI